jgi:hypothetical protein
MDALYVDIDTRDLTSTSFTSSLLDDQLRQAESVPVLDEQGRPWAQRFAPPPSHKPALATYAGRAWAAGDVAYTKGCVLAVTGSNSIEGAGTDWPANFAGRLLYIAGAARPYNIVAVDTINQFLTLDRPVGDILPKFSLYAIRATNIDRRLIFYSEPGEMESWPPWNSVAIPDDDDEVVALVRHQQALCVIGRRHIYRLVVRSDPALDGNMFLMAYRGAVGHRVVAQAEGVIYCLDESGIHAYDGNESTEPISYPIQTVFVPDGLSTTLNLDWESDRQRLWHASVDPTRTVIRWFVDLIGKESLTHALCYNYRSKTWWFEQYPFEVTSACTGTVGHRRTIAGANLRRVFALGEGTTDVVAGSGSLRGTVSRATSISLEDDAASFPATLAGTPVAILEGTGKGQTAIIVTNTATTLTLLDPWDTNPDDTSVYQIGGVEWEWHSGWLDVTPSEESTFRDVVLSYNPVDSDTTVSAELIYDYDSRSVSWGTNWSADGVRCLDGDTEFTFDLAGARPSAGLRLFRGQTHHTTYDYGPSYMQLQMRGVTNLDVVRVYRITLSGASNEE